MKTYKVLSLLFLLLITLSCNVVKMLKQDDGKIPDDFFKGKGPIVDDTITFFTCNLYYTCYFDTKTEQVVDFYSSAGGNFYPYNGNIYFSDGGKTYKYDFNNVTEITDDADTSIVATNFTEFQGHVYFLNGTELYYINNQDQYIQLGTLNSNWLTAVHSDQGNSKFYSCNNTSYELKRLTINYSNGEPPVFTESGVSDGSGNTVNCGSAGDNFQVHGNFIYLDGSTIKHYASDINQMYSETNPSSPVAINMTGQGGFFYVDSSSELKRYNFFQDGIKTISTSNFVSLPVIESSDEYFYVGYDDAYPPTDQLYRMKKTDPTDSGVALTNLPASTYIEHFEVGSRGFYFFTNNGIYKFEFSSGQTVLLHSLSFDGSENFSTFSHPQIYQN